MKKKLLYWSGDCLFTTDAIAGYSFFYITPYGFSKIYIGLAADVRSGSPFVSIGDPP